MCGIIGTANLNLNESVLSKLGHRGPDGWGFEQINFDAHIVFLGHTRLSILDLSPAGRQPMQSHDGRWWLTFNGEIYNHLELRSTLSGSFRGHSDTETLVELIAAQGIEKTLPRLNGMFAFAALDTHNHTLYLARDPFGIKPLYFHHDRDRFAFASEVRALSALPIDTAPDDDGLRQFLTLRYTPSPRTLWRNIQRLAPGHWLAFDLKHHRLSCTSYIQPRRDSFTGTLDEAVEAYQSTLAAAVKRQLLSDVPVGLLLSGGVDSALIAAMAKDAGTELPCYTVGFGTDEAECEIADAQETARVLGLPFHSVTTTAEQLRTALPAIVNAVEEPLGTTSVMPMWYLVQRAREDVTVVLTGQGSDEPWGGYLRYQVELLRPYLPALFWQTGARLTTGWHTKPDALERGLRTLSETDPAHQILEACALFSAEERQWLLGSDEDGGAIERIRAWLAWLQEVPGLSGAERMMRLDTRMNLADDLLLYGDKISMAVSLEARVPMLDVELVRFIESLPIEYRIRRRQGKRVHKRMAERYLPHEIVHRPKKGFQVPFGSWSRGPWRGWVEEQLLDGLGGWLNRSGVERLWRRHLAGRPDRSRQMFALLMLALWRNAQN